MARRQIRVVIDGDGVLPEAARRLHHQHDIARLHRGDDDLAVGVAAAVDEQLAGRRAPVLLHRLGELCGQRAEPGAIVLGGQSNRITHQLDFGEPVGVLAAALDQRVNQRVAVLGVDTGNVADLVSRVAHGAQQGDGAGGRVEPDRVADAGVFGRICGEHQRHPLVLWRNGTQPRMAHREAGNACAALRVRDVGDQPFFVDLLEGERDGDDAAVELRHRHLCRDVERAEAVVVVPPL